MAQTGFTPIQLYSSSTATNVPLAANLATGELAINITDGKLFYKDNAAAVQVIGWKVVPTTAGGTGLTSYTAGDLPYYATGTTLSKLGIGASTTVLTSSGTAPQWTAQSALSVGTAANLLSNATTGVMQITGPGTGTTRVMTIPNANFTVARLDGAQTFTAAQTIEGTTQIFTVGSSTKKLYFYPDSSGEAITTQTLQNGAGVYFNDTLDSVHLNTGGTYRLSANTAGNVTVETGNLIIGTSGKGIDFSATAGTGTSELLADYEEGTWTPNQGGGLVVVGAFSSTGSYIKVGRLVTVTGKIAAATSVTTTAGSAISTNLPFTAENLATVGMGGLTNNNINATGATWVSQNSTSLFATASIGPTTAIWFNLTYIAA